LKNLTVQHIQNIVRIVAKAIAPPAKRVSAFSVEGPDPERRENANGEGSSSGKLIGMEKWVGTGDVGMDEVLGGGIRTGVLTEISGERSVISRAEIMLGRS
jgi:hypothetical protein